MQRGSGTWGSLSGGGSRVREWCPLALHTSRSWGCCTAEHTGKCPSSLFPSAFLCPASEWFPGRTDSKRAIPADLMSHHCLFPKALPYIQQHPINTLLGPRHPVIFPPVASHWISFIAYSFMWSSNNSLCTSLRGPSSGSTQGTQASSRGMYGCLSIPWAAMRGVQLVRQWCCEPTFPLLGVSFSPWRLLPAAREISSLQLRNNKIPLTLITAWALWKPFWAGSVVLNRTNRMRDALISVQAVKLNKSGFNEKVAVVQWCSFQLPTYFKKTNPSC